MLLVSIISSSYSCYSTRYDRPFQCLTTSNNTTYLISILPKFFITQLLISLLVFIVTRVGYPEWMNARKPMFTIVPWTERGISTGVSFSHSSICLARIWSWWKRKNISGLWMPRKHVVGPRWSCKFGTMICSIRMTSSALLNSNFPICPLPQRTPNRAIWTWWTRWARTRKWSICSTVND